MKTLHKITLFSVFFLSLTSYAQSSSTPIQMVRAIDHIQDLPAVITALKKNSKLSVIFPAVIPKDTSHQNYYASLDSSALPADKGYLINIGYTEDCKGAQVCNVGYLSAENAGQIQMFADRNNKTITEKVTLTRGIAGYYTPGHAMGSYFPPTLQWQDGNMLFMLSWDDHLIDRTAMVDMANTAILAGQW